MFDNGGARQKSKGRCAEELSRKDAGKILSVSIAAYNSEKYLEKCLDTLVASRYVEDIEILVVNDGSTDSTPAIAESYAKRFPRSVILINKENGGYGSTINAAMARAAGRYFKTLDADDWVDTAAFDRMVEKLKTCGADMLVNNYVRVFPNREEIVDVCRDWEEDHLYELDGEEISFPMFPMHSFSVKLAALKKSGEQISEHCFYTDNEYDVLARMGAGTCEFQRVSVYDYRLGCEEQSMSAQGLYRHIEDAFVVGERLAFLCKKWRAAGLDERKHRTLEAYARNFYRGLFGWFMKFSLSEKDALFAEFDRKMCGEYPEIAKPALQGALRFQMIRLNPVIGFQIARPLSRLHRGLKKS